jgi:hypothetical protein
MMGVLLPDSAREILTLDDAFVVIFILVAIVVIETVIIVSLANWAGSLRKLFRLAANESKKPAHNPSEKKGIASDEP